MGGLQCGSSELFNQGFINDLITIITTGRKKTVKFRAFFNKRMNGPCHYGSLLEGVIYFSQT